MPKSRFHGLIKDYDGGTLMECYVHPAIDYTRIPEMLEAQKEFIMRRIRTVSRSDKVIYPPLPKGWKPMITGHSSRGNEAASKAIAIPGMVEAGWTMADLLASTAAAKDRPWDGWEQGPHRRCARLWILYWLHAARQQARHAQHEQVQGCSWCY